MILSLEQSVPDNLRAAFKRLFVVTITCVTSLYVTFGASGYLSFGKNFRSNFAFFYFMKIFLGPETKDIITLNLPRNSGLDFALLVKMCLCISLFFTYPVMLFPVSALIQQRLTHAFVGLHKDDKIMPVAIRFALVTTTGNILWLMF